MSTSLSLSALVCQPGNQKQSGSCVLLSMLFEHTRIKHCGRHLQTIVNSSAESRLPQECTLTKYDESS